MTTLPLLEGDLLTPRRAAQWIALLLALGVLARLVRFGLGFPLWADEAFLSASYLDRGYLGLLQPLEYHQVCPLFFLWVQLTATKLLGFSECSLRLFPLLCSLASLALFQHAARRLFRGGALVVAIGIFAAGYPGIRFANDAKPYGCDVLMALTLLTLLLEWWRRPERTRWLWALAAAAPLAVGFSYPVVFTAGGISLTVACLMTMTPGARGWRAWLAYNLSLGAAFLTFYWLCVRSQNAELSIMRSLWDGTFPPLDSAWRLIVWLARQHAGNMMDHPVGGAGAVTSLACVVGAVILCRRRQFLLPLLGVATLALNFVAAALHRYPYGGQVRFSLFLMPLISLLAGLGFAAIADRFFRREGRGRAIPLLALAALGLIPLGSMVRDFHHPGKSDDDIRYRDFNRWFWFEMSCDAELVCLDVDRATRFGPAAFEFGSSALYLCEQRIYCPHDARLGSARLERVSARHPLRCVRYRAHGYPDDQARLSAWLDAMQRRYDLAARQEYPIGYRDPDAAEGPTAGWVVMYEFVPKRP